jgi:hypothetical protein
VPWPLARSTIGADDEMKSALGRHEKSCRHSWAAQTSFLWRRAPQLAILRRSPRQPTGELAALVKLPAQPLKRAEGTSPRGSADKIDRRQLGTCGDLRGAARRASPTKTDGWASGGCGVRGGRASPVGAPVRWARAPLIGCRQRGSATRLAGGL